MNAYVATETKQKKLHKFMYTTSVSNNNNIDQIFDFKSLLLVLQKTTHCCLVFNNTFFGQESCLPNLQQQ